jgi:hypothetical protein
VRAVEIMPPIVPNCAVDSAPVARLGPGYLEAALRPAEAAADIQVASSCLCVFDPQSLGERCTKVPQAYKPKLGQRGGQIAMKLQLLLLLFMCGFR